MCMYYTHMNPYNVYFYYKPSDHLYYVYLHYEHTHSYHVYLFYIHPYFY